MFCRVCGQQVHGGQYCPKCGSKITYDNMVQTVPVKKKKAPNLIFLIGVILLLIVTVVFYALFNTEITGWIISLVGLIVALLLIVIFARKHIAISMVSLISALVLVSLVFVFMTPFKSVNGNDLETNNNETKTDIKKSSIRSVGLPENDMGNIVNGQFYFSDGTMEYYSSFDSNCAAHIYKKTKGTEDAVSIFDGFGWSLVIKDDWLYFSGNKGAIIDNTYHLYRMKTDGSQLEELNQRYSFGMNIYGSWLYYMSESAKTTGKYDICRCDLDGKNETIIRESVDSSMFIYNNKLYYLEVGNIMVSDPDGKNPEVISNDPSSFLLIGEGKLICQGNDGTTAGSIRVMDVNGENVKTIPVNSEYSFGRINSYKDRIYYALYNTNYNYSTYSYHYYVYSMKFDGTDNKLIYESDSYGFYFNLANDKFYVLDYAKEQNTDKMPAIAKIMNLDGTNQTVLQRN